MMGLLRSISPPTPSARASRLYKQILHEKCLLRCKLHNSLDSVLCAQRPADAIQFFIPTFKNPDFEEEAEWRLDFTPNPLCLIKRRFRVRDPMLVPYYRLRDLAQSSLPVSAAALSQLPIGHVTVGPGAAKVLNVESVRMLLNGYGYTGILIEAPIRHSGSEGPQPVCLDFGSLERTQSDWINRPETAFGKASPGRS